MFGGAAVLIATVLKVTGEILLPLLFAVFLSVVCAPAVRGLVRIKVPRAVAVALVILVMSGVLVGGTVIVGNALTQFTERLPVYQQPLRELVDGALLRLEEAGLPRTTTATELVDPSALFPLVGQTLGALFSTLGRLVLVVLYTSFILVEMVQIEEKFKAAFEGNVEVSRSLIEGAATVQRYLAIKTGASLATGLIVGLAGMLMGLDFYVLWAVLAFAFNYVPTIGSIIAAIPAVALALVQLGPGWAVGLGLVYLATNFVIGNVIEPRILGRKLGLSPLVVLISLFFWGWMWGPAGMLIGVPMTVVLKLLLEINPETRWLAVLLGDAREIRQLRARAGGWKSVRPKDVNAGDKKPVDPEHRLHKTPRT